MNSTPQDSRPSPLNRREFLITTAAAGAAAAAAPTGLLPLATAQTPAPRGAGEKIRIAVIGTGNQGSAHIRHLRTHAAENNIELVAVCDLYEKRLDKARAAAELPEASAYKDHRRLLERKDIDAVVVAVVDNWHSEVAIDALESGKHVYGEKPMSRYLTEGFRLYDTVKKTGKVFQLGSQYCADPMFHKAAEWIKAGKLGPLVWAQGSYCRNNPKNSEWTYPVDADATEKNLDWARWQGRAKKYPWDPNRYFSWHKYYDYNSGILGNLLPHKFLPMMLASASPEFPRRVTCLGTRQVSTDREITDTTHLLAEFPNGLTLCVAGSTVNEQGLPDIIRGRKATLYLSSGQNQIQLKPERPFVEELDPEDFSSPLPMGSVPRLHANFFSCIRNGGTPYANVDLALRAHVVLCLAEMSERMGLMLYYDADKRTVRTGDGRVVPPISYETDTPRTT